MTRPLKLISRPVHVNGEGLCLAAYVTINGIQAYTLFDSGSTTDAVTPDFTRVAKLPTYTLDDPVTLQLGCIGSRSKINFGSIVKTEFASVTADTYVDIANRDEVSQLKK
jgi:hypothetical protein